MSIWLSTKKGTIFYNIRLVLDILDYSDFFSNDNLILFLDYYKAFDSLEHEFCYRLFTRWDLVTSFVDLLKCFTLIAIALSNSAVVPLLDLLSIGESGRDAQSPHICF